MGYSKFKCCRFPFASRSAESDSQSGVPPSRNCRSVTSHLFLPQPLAEESGHAGNQQSLKYSEAAHSGEFVPINEGEDDETEHGDPVVLVMKSQNGLRNGELSAVEQKLSNRPLNAVESKS